MNPFRNPGFETRFVRSEVRTRDYTRVFAAALLVRLKKCRSHPATASCIREWNALRECLSDQRCGRLRLLLYETKWFPAHLWPGASLPLLVRGIHLACHIHTAVTHSVHCGTNKGILILILILILGSDPLIAVCLQEATGYYRKGHVMHLFVPMVVLIEAFLGS